ncbi:MAG: TRAP transporter small permease [Thermodesulfobacteriota bacterium]
MLRAIIAAINKTSSFFGLLSGILICVLACLLIYDVFMRFAINRPVDWTLDITQLLQAAIAFLAAAYVLKIDGHVNMSAVVSNLGPKWGRRLTITANAITGLTSAWMCWLSWSLFTKSLAISEKSFGIEIPLAPWKLLVSIGFGLMCLQGLSMALNLWLHPEEFTSDGREGH